MQREKRKSLSITKDQDLVLKENLCYSKDSSMIQELLRESQSDPRDAAGTVVRNERC